MSGKQNGKGNGKGKEGAKPYVVFSNEDAIGKIEKRLAFLKIEPIISSKIIIKDKEGNPFKNKNGDILYYYNITYAIKSDDGLIHNIKFSQRTDALLSSSKMINMYNVQLYINSEKKVEICTKLFSKTEKINILGTETVVKYSEFETDKTYGTISFNIVNDNARNAVEYVYFIIKKLNIMLTPPKERTVSNLNPNSPSFPPLTITTVPTVIPNKSEVTIEEVTLVTIEEVTLVTIENVVPVVKTTDDKTKDALSRRLELDIEIPKQLEKHKQLDAEIKNSDVELQKQIDELTTLYNLKNRIQMNELVNLKLDIKAKKEEHYKLSEFVQNQLNIFTSWADVE